MADFDDTTADVAAAPVPDAPETAAPAPEAEASEPSVADIAMRAGWSPRDKFTGDPAKWKPAGEFLAATVDINRKMSKEVRELRTMTERMASTSAAIVEQQVAERVAAAEARFEAAVEAGDTRAARIATNDISREQAKLSAARIADDPEASFAADNPWYNKDDEATAFAIGISSRLAQQGKSVAEQLEAAQAGVRKRFPELFNDKPAGKAPPSVNAPATRTAPSNRAKGVNDLPPSARRAAEDFARKIPGMTVDTYAKTYWAERAKDEAA